MTIGEAKDILKTVRFLHFKFDVMDMHGSHQWALTISYSAPDTQNRGIEVPLKFQKILPNCSAMNVKEFMLLVYDAVIDSLKHEASELFKVNDVDVFNEHDNVKAKLDIVNKMFKLESDYYRYPFSMENAEARWNTAPMLQELEYKYIRNN